MRSGRGKKENGVAASRAIEVLAADIQLEIGPSSREMQPRGPDTHTYCRGWKRRYAGTSAPDTDSYLSFGIKKEVCVLAGLRPISVFCGKMTFHEPFLLSSRLNVNGG